MAKPTGDKTSLARTFKNAIGNMVDTDPVLAETEIGGCVAASGIILTVAALALFPPAAPFVAVPLLGGGIGTLAHAAWKALG